MPRTDTTPDYLTSRVTPGQSITLLACSMNIEFLYMLPGWEGGAANSHIFNNAQNQDFQIPNGCYLS